MEVTVIRSNRKTVAIQVNSDLSVTVRAPRLASKKDIDRFIEEKETWICKHIEEIKKKKERYEAEKSEKLTHEELTALADKALDIIPRRVEYFAKQMGEVNAQLLKACFGDYCKNDVVYNPTEDNLKFDGQVLVAAGWKPGFSTDTDAVYLGEKFDAKTIVNLSNIEKVYTDDPRKNPDAKPLDTIFWADFRKMVGDEWTPGKNCPFDPIASKKASELSMKVICAGGKNIPNIQAILEDKEYFGTTIG